MNTYTSSITAGALALALMAGTAFAQAVIYEPFDDTNSTLNGSTPGTGLSGTWSAAGDYAISNGSLSYASLPTSGNHTRNTSTSLRSAGVAIGPELAAAGLMDDDAELWFSFLANAPQGANVAYEFALATEKVDFYGGIDASNNGSGVGVQIQPWGGVAAAIWPSSDSIRDTGSSTGSMTTDTTALIVGKITWGYGAASNDTIELYMPATDLLLPASPVSTLSNVLDQSQFDMVTFDGKDQQSPRIDEIRFGKSYNDVVSWDFVASPDTTPPTPDPVGFDIAPSPVTAYEVTMTASRASDLSGVEYYFTCTNTNGFDSGWQQSRTYNATNLLPSTEYTFTVTARDMSPSNNMTTASAPLSVTTFSNDTTPPTPNPMTFAVNPAPISNTEISMTADTATDDTYDVEYYFTETSGNPGGSDSGWQSSPTYVDGGLTSETLYTYTVTARDMSPNQNAGTASGPQSATTLPPDVTPPSPSPATWDVPPTATSSNVITMTATTATDINGVEYYFANLSVDDGSHDSGWQDSPTYTDTGLESFTAYSYELRTRDKSYAQNASTPSDPTHGLTDLPAGTTPALVEGLFYTLGSENAPTSLRAYDVSVYPGKAMYSGVGNRPDNSGPAYVVAPFGNGTVEDYRFFCEGPGETILSYAIGEGGIIADPTTADTSLDSGSFADLWTTNDPGGTFTSTADYTANTILSDLSPGISGTIDISTLKNGIVYFIYGAYRSTPSFDLVMSGTGQTDVTLNSVGDNDFANNGEEYIVAVKILNAGSYSTLDYIFNTSNGKVMGIVVWQIPPPPAGTVFIIK